MKRLRVMLALSFCGLLIAVPYAYSRVQRFHYRNLRVVTPNVLLRSGQLSETGLADVLRDHDIRTVITLRDDDGSDHAPSKWEEDFLARNYIKHVRIPVRQWYSDNGPSPAAHAVQRFLEVMQDSRTYPRPVLIHCFAGAHRTGGLCAVYRMEFDHWPVQKALQEMKDLGYVNLDKEDDIRGFLLAYRPTWKK